MLEVEIQGEVALNELIDAVKSHPKPYLRERASAVIQVYEGRSATEVAKNGLLIQRHPQTVRSWIHSYNEEGFEGLKINEGRGRKPAFSP